MSRPASRLTLDRLRERIRRIEAPHSHGVLPFGVLAIDRALPGGGLPLGVLHEVRGTGGDEEDGAAAAGFIAGILARLGVGPGSAVPRGGRGGAELAAASLPLRPSYKVSRLRPKSAAEASRFCPPAPAGLTPAELATEGNGEAGAEIAGAHPEKDGDGAGDAAGRQRAGEAGPGAGPVLWCLRRPDLYGPGLLAHGLDPARIVLVTARRGDELLWAAEEALRAGSAAGLAAVVAEIGGLPIAAGRRLQLAAERSGITAFLLRRWRGAAEAAAERERPNPALTRWRITALPSLPESARSGNPLSPGERGGGIAAAACFGTGIGRPRWQVELLRVRGGAPGCWEVEIADATGRLHLSAALADRPAAPSPPCAPLPCAPLPCAGAAVRRTG